MGENKNQNTTPLPLLLSLFSAPHEFLLSLPEHSNQRTSATGRSPPRRRSSPSAPPQPSSGPEARSPPRNGRRSRCAPFLSGLRHAKEAPGRFLRGLRWKPRVFLSGFLREDRTVRVDLKGKAKLVGWLLKGEPKVVVVVVVVFFFGGGGKKGGAKKRHA